jgi:hypothetical protein
MVTGLDKFIEHFLEFNSHYILIGGGACDWQMRKKGLPFRATKDLDIILIVEALSNEFVTHFWQFIKDGEYSIAEVGEKRVFYRFIYPKTEGYPKMLELFSRKPATLLVTEGIHLTDIPTDEEASSLSAILLEDEYYHFTLTNSVIIDNLHLANEFGLISLKVKAFLNNKARKETGKEIREDDIYKHKRDVIRLTTTLPPDMIIEVPMKIKEDIRQFVEILQEENTPIGQLLKNQGMGRISPLQIIEQLQKSFGLGGK